MEIKLRNDVFAQFSLVISTLLFLEWIYPLGELELVSRVGVFIGFVLFLVVLRLVLVIPFSIRFLAIVVWIFASLKFIYFSSASNYFIELKNQLSVDVFNLLGFEFHSISFVTQTLLLFILLWLLVDIFLVNVVEKDKFIYLFVPTIIFIASMDTFTIYDGTFALIRVLLFSFLLFGLRTFYHNIRFTKVTFKNKFETRWLTIIVVFLFVSSILGFAVPKLEPKLPDPFPFITAWIQAEDDSSGEMPVGYVKEVGLGEDDSVLGGPLVGNDTVVFQAISSTRELGYFRVESKDVYTGLGWETNNELVQPPANTFVQVVEQFDEGTVELAVEQVEVMAFDDLNYVPYQTFSLSLGEQFDFTNERNNFNRFTNELDTRRFSNSFYRVKMERDILRNAKKPAEEIINQYTALPDSLPQEVIDLAAQITFGISNDFDKVIAIENYLKSGIFTYDTVNVPYASENIDYVYEFLFETRRGYCVNFSTAMAVLLRAVDIPATWVKGYTQGEIVDTTSTGSYIYEVTNDNAHAWVEVYFDGVGWMPFDPTIGFSTNLDLVNQIYTAEELLNNSTPPVEEETSNLTPEIEENLQNIIKQNKQTNHWAWIIIGIFIVIQCIILYIYRLKWLPYYYIWKMERYHKSNAPDKALTYLFNYLRKIGFEKGKSETLEEFFKRVNNQLKFVDFTNLLSHYTKWLYAKNKNDSWDEILPEWKEIMKKLSTLD